MKKLLSVILSAIILLTVFTVPVTASAISKKITSGDYIYVVKDDGTADIQKYIGKSAKVSVPNTIDGKNVTRIASWAFSKNDKITYVKIPDSVKSLGHNVFDSCTNLQNVNFGKGITIIPDGTFFFCKKMNKTFKIPSQVVSVGEEALPEKITTLVIGDKLKSFRKGTFNYEFNSLKEIKVSKNNKYYCSKNGVLYNKTKTKLLSYPGNKSGKTFNVPKSVKVLEEGSFSYQIRLHKVVFSKNLKKINDCAFLNSDNLDVINIPKNITYIGVSAFAGCEYVEKLNIDANKKLEIEDQAFSGIGLEKVKVPKTDGVAIFSCCTELKKITIPKDVKVLTEREFYGCVSLKTVTIPKTVKTIEKHALGYYENDYGYIVKIKGFTIKGYKGSAAQRYAKKNGFKFVCL